MKFSINIGPVWTREEKAVVEALDTLHAFNAGSPVCWKHSEDADAQDIRQFVWGQQLQQSGLGATRFSVMNLLPTTAQAFGYAGVEDLYSLYQKPMVMLAKKVWDCFFADEQEKLLFELASPTKTVVKPNEQFGLHHAELLSSGIQDKPARIAVSPVAIRITWGRRLVAVGNHVIEDRDIDLGPAAVELQPNGYRIQHYAGGDRVKGHSNWRTRCAASNPWLKFYSE